MRPWGVQGPLSPISESTPWGAVALEWKGRAELLAFQRWRGGVLGCCPDEGRGRSGACRARGCAWSLAGWCPAPGK